MECKVATAAAPLPPDYASPRTPLEGDDVACERVRGRERNLNLKFNDASLKQKMSAGQYLRLSLGNENAFFSMDFFSTSYLVFRLRKITSPSFGETFILGNTLKKNALPTDGRTDERPDGLSRTDPLIEMRGPI